MSTAVQYAYPVEVLPWDEERNPSAYVIPFDEKRTLSVDEYPFTCKFFFRNDVGKADDAAKNDLKLSYFNVAKLTSKLLKNWQRNESREAALEEVRAFANYLDDWDGYGAVRPLSDCLMHAMNIIRNKNIRLDYLSDIYPNPNGTLSLEWEKDENEIGLEVGKEEFSYYAHFGEYHSYNNRKPYVAEEIERLAEFVSYLR